MKCRLLPNELVLHNKREFKIVKKHIYENNRLPIISEHKNREPEMKIKK